MSDELRHLWQTLRLPMALLGLSLLVWVLAGQLSQSTEGVAAAEQAEQRARQEADSLLVAAHAYRQQAQAEHARVAYYDSLAHSFAAQADSLRRLTHPPKNPHAPRSRPARLRRPTTLQSADSLLSAY